MMATGLAMERVGADPKVSILGISVCSVTTANVIENLADGIQRRSPQTLMYVNAHTLNLAARDTGFRDVLNGASWVVNDGVGVSIAARMRGRSFPENLNGTDLNWRLLELAAQQQLRVFLFGGRPGVADLAAKHMKRVVPGLTICGVQDGFTSLDGEELPQLIRSLSSDFVMVALGNPLQEEWLATHFASTGALLGVGVGAFFDFASGRALRAPVLLRRLRLEWLFRLASDPKRLWRRYVLGNPEFIWRALISARREFGR